MKKWIALVVAVMLVLSLSASALSVESLSQLFDIDESPETKGFIGVGMSPDMQIVPGRFYEAFLLHFPQIPRLCRVDYTVIRQETGGSGRPSWVPAQGCIAKAVYYDGANQPYSMTGISGAMSVPGDSGEIDLAPLLNRLPYLAREVGTVDTYYAVLMFVPEEGKPWVSLIVLPMDDQPLYEPIPIEASDYRASEDIKAAIADFATSFSAQNPLALTLPDGALITVGNTLGDYIVRWEPLPTGSVDHYCINVVGIAFSAVMLKGFYWDMYTGYARDGVVADGEGTPYELPLVLWDGIKCPGDATFADIAPLLNAFPDLNRYAALCVAIMIVPVSGPPVFHTVPLPI